ncbi:Morn repeat protein 1 (nucleomorph) [Lotharella oceanica]|uniref:Morn repeat protein 1 n=1 Tax=Lotharella oceanica TaxID=641309 RepID=A0A060DGT7_9EUKA|nr:Morn repeat protein 1 [Lotharella oceanica]|mmetsp:Transcript_4142/g.7942  ORF Transcript_4142/g.7942 Transcript_4142/m.7942 type:complete len:296 (+) Transcript_4142:2724-3611(+)
MEIINENDYELAQGVFYRDPRWVGKGVIKSKDINNIDNNTFIYSNHPLSPFKGESFKWNSWNFDDGSTYEGLTLENTPHGKGIVTLGLISNCGINIKSKNERYEGEFYSGFAHGLGSLYEPKTFDMYFGEFTFGRKQGCGLKFNLDSFFRLINSGLSVKNAWLLSKNEIKKRAIYGYFHDNIFLSENIQIKYPKIYKYCNIEEIRGVLCELKNILVKTRMFQFKPDTLIFNKKNLDEYTFLTLQDPLRYPFCTEFLAPGPVGQCYSIPNDSKMIKEMFKIAKNYNFIYNQYNLSL